MKSLIFLLVPTSAVLLASCAAGPPGPGYGGPGYSGHDTVYVEGRDHDDHDHGGYNGTNDPNHRNVTNVNEVNVNRTNVTNNTVNKTNTTNVKSAGAKKTYTKKVHPKPTPAT